MNSTNRKLAWNDLHRSVTLTGTRPFFVCPFDSHALSPGVPVALETWTNEPYAKGCNSAGQQNTFAIHGMSSSVR